MMTGRAAHRSRDATTRRWRVLIALVVGAGWLLVTAGPASAHAQLVSTDPPAGSVLSEAPDAVTVTFDEAVETGDHALRVFDADGDEIDTGRLTKVDGGKGLRVTISDGAMPDGGYIVTWRILSADGHPVDGGITFRVGTTSDEVDTTVLEQLLQRGEGSSALSVASIVARALMFAGIAVTVGGTALIVVAWPAGAGDVRGRRVLLGGLLAAGLGTVAGIGLQAADVAGLGLVDAIKPSVAFDILDTDYGRAAVLRLVLLVVGAVALHFIRPTTIRSPRWYVPLAVLGGAILTTVTFSGHARTGRWISLAGPADVIHLTVGALWVGGLVMLALAVLPVSGRSGAFDVAKRFSPVALVSVVLVTITGSVQGLRQLDGLDGLVDTTYGRLLLVKVLAVTAMVALGLSSRQATFADHAEPGLRMAQLRQSVIGEASLAAIVIIATAMLVAANPSGAADEPESFSATRVVDGTLLEVIVAPAATGPVDVHVYVQNPTSGLTDGVLDATATLALPDEDIDGVVVPLIPAGRNHFSAYDVEVPIAGDWELDVNVVVDEFDSLQTSFTVPIE
jgi:copper transport protein